MNEWDDKKQKALELLRSQTDSSVLDKSSYTSPLDQDIMKVKSNPSPTIPETPKVVKGATPHINTKDAQKVMSGSSWANKIKALRGLSKGLPALGAITALGTGLMSDNASAGEIASDVVSELPSAIPVAGTIYDAARPTTSGPEQGSFEDRLEKGQLTPEELEMLKSQYMGNNG